MDTILISTVFLCIISCTNSLIIPEELPSILSLIYSNIPPIKKGTDSRVGFGFRLGEHADFQVLFELGPQTETRPLGGSSTNSNKRQVPNRNGVLQLWQQTDKPQAEKISDSDGGKWLAEWQKSMKRPAPPLMMVFPPETDAIEGLGEIKASDVIPEEPSGAPLSELVNKVKVLDKTAGSNDSSGGGGGKTESDSSDLSDVSLDGENSRR